VVHSHKFNIEGPQLLAAALCDLEGERSNAMLFQLRFNEGQRQRGTDERDISPKLQKVGHGTNVVLVPVSQHNGHDVVQAVSNRGKIGQNQVDTGLCLLRKQHPAVDDKQLALDFKHGHVATDFAYSAQRHNAKSARLERWRFTQWLGHTALSGCSGYFGQRPTSGSVAVGTEVGEIETWHSTH